MKHVILISGKMGSHPSEIDLDDYLTKFDALYDSSKASVSEMVRDIVENYKAKVKR